jgi:hypothetical protein
MAIQYTNRRGQTYYLHYAMTRAGKPSYFFSLNDQGNLVDALPWGYEPYESPNGLFFLRKIRAKLITDDEIALVEKELKRNRHLRSYRIDVKKETINVYTPNQDVEGLSSLLHSIGESATEIEAALARTETYTAEMRFILRDKEKRHFVLQRHTYVSSLPEWLDIRGPEPLKNLAAFVKYLGSESFFELSQGAHL